MSRRSRLGPRAESGFTLVELVVTVAIVGIITSALAEVVLSFLRTTVDTQARLTESHDVQFAAAYWQRDVASLGVRSSTFDSATHSYPLLSSIGGAACPLPAGATAVVTLAWSEYGSLLPADPPALVRVTWAVQPQGAVYHLLRVRCGSDPSSITVADSLSAVPTVTCSDAAGTSLDCTGGGAAVPAQVRLALTVHDGSGHQSTPYTATLAGERRQS